VLGEPGEQHGDDSSEGDSNGGGTDTCCKEGTWRCSPLRSKYLRRAAPRQAPSGERCASQLATLARFLASSSYGGGSPYN